MTSIGFGSGSGALAGAMGGVAIAGLGGPVGWAIAGGLAIGAVQGYITGAQTQDAIDQRAEMKADAKKGQEMIQKQNVATAKTQLRAMNNSLGGTQMSLARAKRSLHAARIVSATGGEHVSFKDTREMRPTGRPVLV